VLKRLCCDTLLTAVLSGVRLLYVTDSCIIWSELGMQLGGFDAGTSTNLGTVGANTPLGRQPDKMNRVGSLQRLQKPTACVYPDPHQSRTPNPLLGD
jgi:hypothetical protein